MLIGCMMSCDQIFNFCFCKLEQNKVASCKQKLHHKVTYQKSASKVALTVIKVPENFINPDGGGGGGG